MSGSRNIKRYFSWAFDAEKQRRLTVLRDVPLFRDLPAKLLRKLMIDLIEKDYAPGETIFREGEPGKALYVLLDGSVRIVKAGNPSEKSLALLGPGSHFGELALVTDRPRFASAIADTDCRLLIMYRAYFEDLIRSNNAISSRVLLNLAASLVNYLHSSGEKEPAP